jgi:phage tail sheath protein FI
MASAPYTKPGVYVEETLTPNLPIAPAISNSVAVLIGVADRGPTATSGSNVVGVPTLVSTWSDFVNTFSFGSSTNTFSGAGLSTSTTGTASSGATTVTVASTAGITVGMGVSAPNIDPSTVVTSISGSVVTLSLATTAAFTAAAISFNNSPLKYAVKSFFDNGGAGLYVQREINTDATKAGISFRDSNGTATTVNTNSTTAVTATASASATSLAVLSTSGIVVGQNITAVSGLAATTTVTAISSVVATTVATNSALTNTTAVTVATAGVAVGQIVTGTTSITTGTYVKAVGSGAITISATTASAITNQPLVFTANNLTISPATTGTVADAAVITLVGNTFDFTTSTTALSIISTAATFPTATVGKSISFSGVTATGYTGLNSGRYVISAVSADASSISIVYKGTAIPIAGQSTAVSVVNAAVSTTPTLTVTAKDPGSWGQEVWVGIYPNNNALYFDLHVFYSATATSSTQLTDANRVERFTKLSMDPTDPRYFVNSISSKWINVADASSSATEYNDLPAFTGAWGTALTSANVIATTGAFTWNSSGFNTSTIQAAKLGLASTTTATLAASSQTGSDGTAVATAATYTYPQLDNISQPLIINHVARTDATSINALTQYAATRTDSFVVIDTLNDTVSNTLSAIKSYNTNQNYGAVYYPNIVIADPASTTSAPKTIAPGGAVAALYTVTDTSRGVFKAPAGSATRINSAVSVYSLSSDEFNLVGGTTPNLNIIRFVPGAGICIMGARTLKSANTDIYVPVRRSLNYLSSNLKNITQFAVFEPNDANLWAKVNGIVSGFLDEFWRNGGLSGASSAQAYYVKCDGSINTPAVVSAGELRIEVGVALQRPAEFVIIKIGQIDGGAVVTTSI